MQIVEPLLDARKDPFQNILDDFLQSPEFVSLEIGAVENIQCLSRFERKFSVQRLYQVTGSKNIKKIYVKIAKNYYGKTPEDFDTALRRDFETNLFWYEKLTGYRQFSSIRPLYLALPFKALITEETIGRNLGEMIRTRLRFSPSSLIQEVLRDYVRNAGKLLYLIRSACEEEYEYDLSDLVEDVDIRMRELVKQPAARFSEKLRQAILNFYDKNMRLAKSQRVMTGYMHRDFTMSNLLVNGEKIIVHDFSKIDVGPGLFDLTRFYHHLGLLKYKPIYSSTAVSKLQRAFLEGYNYPGSTGDILFNFFLLRHYVTHYKGLLRDRDLSLKSKLYDHWVMTKHLQHIAGIIDRKYSH